MVNIYDIKFSLNKSVKMYNLQLQCVNSSYLKSRKSSIMCDTVTVTVSSVMYDTVRVTVSSVMCDTVTVTVSSVMCDTLTVIVSIVF